MILKQTYPDLNPAVISFLETDLKVFIGGGWHSTDTYFDSLNPADGSLLAQIPLADSTMTDQAVLAARKAFEGEWTKTMTSAKRSSLLWRLADLMERDKDILSLLESLDNGKPLNKAGYDVDGAIAHFRYYAGWCTKAEGSLLHPQPGITAEIRREPLGVCALIVPWNFPLMIASWKLAPALACGNTCVLKPAEQTSLSALYLGKLITEAGFPEGVVNIITGPGEPTGSALSSHMDVDKISFTGSTRVGKLIMKAAADSNLKRVSLELGGKSANIIFADAPLEKAFDTSVWSSFYNSGQECTLGSRIFVEESVYEPFISHLLDKARSLTLGAGLTNPDLGPLISRDQLNTVLGYAQRAVQDGAELLLGGNKCDGHLASGYFMEPTVFHHRKDELEIVQEEVFGPVVTVSTFKEEEEVCLRANNSRYALAGAVWTQGLKRAHRMAAALECGTVWINGYDRFDPSVPFGGFKQSGIGKEMGKSAIELYTREKSVWFSY